MSSGYYVILNNAVRNKMNYISLTWPDKHFCAWTLSSQALILKTPCAKKLVWSRKTIATHNYHFVS